MPPDTRPYVLKPAINYFPDLYPRDGSIATLTFTVEAYQQSYIRNNQVIETTPASIYGGFKLIQNDDEILKYLFPNNSAFSLTGRNVYEFGSQSDVNTIALALGAKIGDTVKLNMTFLNRMPIVYLPKDFKNTPELDRNGYDMSSMYFLYPYRSWDPLSSDDLRVGSVSDKESPIVDWKVAGFEDLCWGGTTNEELTQQQWNQRVPNTGYSCYLPSVKIQPRKHTWSGNSTQTMESYYSLKSPLFRSYTQDQTILTVNTYKPESLNSCRIISATKPYSRNTINSFYYDKNTSAGLPNFTSFASRDNWRGSPMQFNILKGFLGGYEQQWRMNYAPITPSVLISLEKVSSAVTPFTGSQLVPTLTATPTYTPTPLPTVTASATAKVTPTPTRTPTTTTTLTSSVTSTPSTTSTLTSTPTPTRTPNFPTPTASPVTKGLLVQVRDVNNVAYQLTRPEIKNMFPGGIGSVSQPYSIGKYEVTNSEYVAFLNAVGQNNANNVYSYSWIPSLSSGMSVTNKNMVLNKTSSVIGWNEQVYSAASFTNGAVCSAKASQINAPIMFGLNSDPTTNSDYTSIDYAWYFKYDGTIEIWENGTVIDNCGAYTTSTLLTITYDGSNIKYWRDGVLQRTVSRPIGSPLFFDSSFYFQSNSINSVIFGPFSSFNEKDAPLSQNRASIIQSGSPGAYTYSVRPGYENKPVNWVTWNSIARYANWLHKNKPVDATGNSVNSGVYDLTQNNPTRSSDAKYWIPSINEHIKAGYYNPTTGGYYKFGTKSNTAPNAGVGGTDTNGAVYNFAGGGTVQNVGSYPNSTSHYGLNDIVGNIREFTDTFYNNFPIAVNGGAVHPNISTSVFVDIEGINALTTSDAPAVAIALDGSFYGSSLGFRIASTDGLTQAEKTSRTIITQSLPTPTPVLQSCAITTNSLMSTSHNYVCKNRLVVKDQIITKLFGGFSVDKDDFDMLKTLGVYFAQKESSYVPETWKSTMEFRADSDLNSIARYMGAKPGDQIELEINYVWRGHEIIERNDGSNAIDIYPYGSINPMFGGKDKYYSTNTTIESSSSNLIAGLSFYQERLSSFNNNLFIKYSDDPGVRDDNIKQNSYGGYILNKITNTFFKYLGKDPKVTTQNSYNNRGGTVTIFTNYLKPPISEISPREPFSYDLAFSIAADSKEAKILLLPALSKEYTLPNGKKIKFLQHNDYDPRSSRCRVPALDNSLSVAVARTNFARSIQNQIDFSNRSIAFYKERMDEISRNANNTPREQVAVVNSIFQNYSKQLEAEQVKISDLRASLSKISDYTCPGSLSMLVRMIVSPPPPPPPSASMTPSLSSIGDVGNLIFMMRLNFESALRDDDHLKEYIKNPTNININSKC